MGDNWFNAQGNGKCDPVLEEHLRGSLASATLHARNLLPNERIDAPIPTRMERIWWLNMTLGLFLVSAASLIWTGSGSEFVTFISILFCVLALLLRIFKSRVIAAILLVGASCSLILAIFTPGLQWASLLPPVLQIAILIKATQATFRINRHHFRAAISLP
jgi:hypothetical protein